MKKVMTFFELKAMYLTELYGLLSMSLETGDFVSDGMALKIEKRIVKGANKTWRKLFRKYRRVKGFYSLAKFNEPKETKPEPPKPSDNLVTVITPDKMLIENAPLPALLEQAKD